MRAFPLVRPERSASPRLGLHGRSNLLPLERRALLMREVFVMARIWKRLPTQRALAKALQSLHEALDDGPADVALAIVSPDEGITIEPVDMKPSDCTLGPFGHVFVPGAEEAFDSTAAACRLLGDARTGGMK